MMKGLLDKYAAYHVWANSLMTERVLLLEPEKLVQPVPSSFPSIRSTYIHMLNAERIWWDRLQKESPVILPVDDMVIAFSEIISEMQDQSIRWKNYVTENAEEVFLQSMEYKNLQGKLFVQPIGEMLLHMFNHGTYHRGQLITMMRILGETQMPQTDFILYSRNNP